MIWQFPDLFKLIHFNEENLNKRSVFNPGLAALCPPFNMTKGLVDYHPVGQPLLGWCFKPTKKILVGDMTYCWKKSGDHQLRLVVYHYKVSKTSNRWSAWLLNHQQYQLHLSQNLGSKPPAKMECHPGGDEPASLLGGVVPTYNITDVVASIVACQHLPTWHTNPRRSDYEYLPFPNAPWCGNIYLKLSPCSCGHVSPFIHTFGASGLESRSHIPTVNRKFGTSLNSKIS